MATDNFMVLVQQDGQICPSEFTGKVDFANPFPGRPNIKGLPQALFEVTEFSFQVGQLNTAPQSTRGKTTFAPLHLTRNVDRASPILFDMCASGTKFNYVDFLQVKSAGNSGLPIIYSGYGLGTVIIKSISYSSSSGEEAPQETVILEYEVLSVGYAQQDSTSKFGPFVIKAWDQAKNARV
jgi:type VI secretion system secreted protein Hcp